MKKLITILFLTLVGTIAQAAPDSDPLKFADDYCNYADDSDACRTAIKNDPSTQVMNHYSLTVRICSKKNINYAPRRSTCFANAAIDMHDFEFRKQVTDCVNATSSWSGNPVNKDWESKANCQSDVFAKRAAAVVPNNAGGGAHRGAGTRP